MGIFPDFLFSKKKVSQRKRTKGETGVIRRTKAELLSLLTNPFPFGIPLTPFGKGGLVRQGVFLFKVSAVGDVGEGRFVSAL